MPTRALVTAAAASYAANCALGIGVATGAIVTGRAHWVHHALYVCTAVLVGSAVLDAARSEPATAARLGPALLPLAVIPFAGTRGTRHPLVALSAAPFIVAALARAWR